MKRAWLVLASLSLAATARADPPAPKSVTHEYSPYEKETISRALAAQKLEIEPSPEGKTIEGVDVVSLDVFEDRDPIPRFFNVFHWTSKPYTISREVLVPVGAPYRKVIVDETARNLRRLANQLSLVLVLAVKGKTPGSVRLLVITKDVWSLRLNSNFSFVGGKLDFLLLQPSEQNVFGTHHVAAAEFLLRPLSYELGGLYKIPWLFGTRVAAAAEAAVIVNRDTKRPEGSHGKLTIGRNLFSTRTEWGWSVEGEWLNEMTRTYRNGVLATFDSRTNGLGVEGGVDDKIPFQWRTTYASLAAAVTRSFGWALKHDVSIGFQGVKRTYDTGPISADPVAVDDFKSRFLPRGDTRVGPYASYRTYTTNFLRVLDVEILGLQEDYRLGHDVTATIYPVLKALGSSRDLFGINLGTQYTVALHDGFMRGSVETTLETQVDQLTDGNVEGRLRIVSPRTPIGRLIFDGQALSRFRNYLNRNSFLGSESRPRGYPTRYFFGPDMVVYSMELRTRALEILKTQWGLVGFWDAGDAFKGWSELKIRHSVGIGIRSLFPQFDRVAFRLDVGFPIVPGGLPPGVSPFAIVFTVDQAFKVPSVVQ